MTSVVIVRNQGKTPAKDIDVTIKIPTVRCALGLGGLSEKGNSSKKSEIICQLRWSKMTTYFMWSHQK